jgi:hypothetical protein
MDGIFSGRRNGHTDVGYPHEDGRETWLIHEMASVIQSGLLSGFR